MSKESKLIKQVVKTNVADKSTFGTNPRDPWSVRYGLNETPLLNRYLKSRGINPEFATKDQKVAHSKTSQFKKWMIDHMNDPVTESVDKKDTITFDIPLLIRVLEFAREELKSDVNLHKMVERLISMRGKGTLTMNQYGVIVKEEFGHLSEERIDEISKELANRYMHSAISDRNKIDDRRMNLNTKQREQMRTQGSISLRRHKNITKMLAKSDKRSEGIGRALDRVTKEETEQLDEISPELQHRYFKAAYAQKNDKTVPKDVRKKRNTGMNKVINRTLRRNTISTPGAAQDFKDQEAKRGIGHVRDHVEVEGQVVENRVVDAVKKAWKSVSDFDSMQPKYDGNTRRRQELKKKLGTDKKKVAEAKEANYGGGYQASVLAVKAKAEKKPVDMASLAARMQASYKKDEKKVKESLEPMAACNQPGDGANTPDDTVTKKSTAKKVKLLLGGKKGQVQEEMYDHEKDDKPSSGLKKPKIEKPGVDSITKEAPQAAAILTGGKTLTGEPRDTIEIDPLMKTRKQAGMEPEPNKPKKSY